MTSAGFSPSSFTLVQIGTAGTTYIFDMATPSLTIVVHQGCVSAELLWGYLQVLTLHT